MITEEARTPDEDGMGKEFLMPCSSILRSGRSGSLWWHNLGFELHLMGQDTDIAETEGGWGSQVCALHSG